MGRWLDAANLLRAEFLLQLRDYLIYMHPEEYRCIELIGGALGAVAAYSIFRRDIARGRLTVKPGEKKTCFTIRLGEGRREERCIDLEKLFCAWRRYHEALARVRSLIRQLDSCKP